MQEGKQGTCNQLHARFSRQNTNREAECTLAWCTINFFARNHRHCHRVGDNCVLTSDFRCGRVLMQFGTSTLRARSYLQILKSTGQRGPYTGAVYYDKREHSTQSYSTQPMLIGVKTASITLPRDAPEIL